jgi:hypothetical protein
LDRFDPLFFGLSPETVDPRLDHFGLHPYRIGYHWQTRCLIL